VSSTIPKQGGLELYKNENVIKDKSDTAEMGNNSRRRRYG
jgi:hypothetical protein